MKKISKKKYEYMVAHKEDVIRMGKRAGNWQKKSIRPKNT